MDNRDPDKLTPAEERALFRREVGVVRPLKQGRAKARESSPPSARPRSTQADEAAVMAALLDELPDGLETGEEQLYARPGLQHSVLRRLRRGHYRCQAELDLHGLFVAGAKIAFVQFLAASGDAGFRCVRIIHGKGLRSGQRGPVLPGKVAAWLRQRDDVLAYCSARPVDGGSGALYVLLRRKP